ncbi:PAAR domain-containing protein [Massilia haematophila]|uniref:PAAR domain-containing protein n=1 Tax=Massilia haematophila TaxID=457923 RepID=A0ABV7PL39_9BURK
MRRYHITLGAKTTVGGVVTTATSFCSINGVRMALEGDTVACPACHADGKILCDGPRLSDKWNGRQAALENDLCVCRCNPPPRLIAVQTHRSQLITAEEDQLTGPAAMKAAQARLPKSMATTDELPLRLVDEATQQPHRHRPYRLDFADKQIEGVTDEDGLTRPLSRADRAALLAWHIADPS